jgi:hypothetical protein
MTTANTKDPWELESGLPNDVDAWMVNCHFGKNDEYMSAVSKTDDATTGTQFIFDLVDAEGNEVGSVGYSVGSGWTPSSDGLTITHDKRANVIRGTRYGDFQEKVLVTMKVDMRGRGAPIEAKIWEGFGAHWMQEDKKSVSGKVNKVLYPVSFLGFKEGIAKKTGAPEAEPVVVDELLMAKLVNLAQTKKLKEFQLAALKLPEAVANEGLMAQIVNDAADGFWATHQKKA